MSDKINAYNKKSSEELGWIPEWFSCNKFDEKLAKEIKKFQKKMGLSADGMCGKGTFRVIYAEIEAQKKVESLNWVTDSSDVIWWNNTPIKIDWPSDKVHTFKDSGFPYPVSKGVTKNSSKREIKSFVTHWDVCLNSMSCAKVLVKKNISIHFCIDNDGTIIQLHDLNDSCWHAGNRHQNKHSVGVEISNAYYQKYQSWYKRNVGKERPIMSGALAQNKVLEDFTWFYPEQIDALKALYKAIHEGCGVPYNSPDTKWAYDSDCGNGKFSGFMNHFHCSKKKIDCGGLDIEEILKDLKK